MPQLTASDISKKVRAGEPDRLYYLYGQDTGALESFVKPLLAKLCPKEARTMNLHRFDGKQLDIPSLADACEALPMFAQRVVITINDLNMDSLGKSDGDDLRRILGDLPDTTSVVIYSTGENLYKNKRSLTDKNKRFADFCAKHGACCEFAFKRASDLAKDISSAFEKEKCSISRSDAEYLAEFCLCDTASIRQEIQKLTSYAPGRQITRSDIDALCIRKVESDGFSLAINILRRRSDFVFKRIRELSDQNYEPIEIIGAIAFSLNDLYRARLAISSGRSLAACTEDMKYPKNREFAIKNAFNECQNIPAERIRGVISVFAEADIRLKTVSSGKQSDMLFLEETAARAMTLKA